MGALAFLSMVAFTFVLGFFRPLDIVAFTLGIVGPILFFVGFTPAPADVVSKVTPAARTPADAAP